MTDAFMKRKHPLARALYANCGLLGERGITEGLKLEWVEVEPVIHDLAHMVTLGLRIQHPANESDEFDLGLTVHNHIQTMTDAAAKENERMTLATQLIFLNRMDAFVDGCQIRWAYKIAHQSSITVDSIYNRVLNSDASLLAHRLHRRLKYHAKPKRLTP